MKTSTKTTGCKALAEEEGFALRCLIRLKNKVQHISYICKYEGIFERSNGFLLEKFAKKRNYLKS
jgi:hypothetical protein